MFFFFLIVFWLTLYYAYLFNFIFQFILFSTSILPTVSFYPLNLNNVGPCWSPKGYIIWYSYTTWKNDSKPKCARCKSSWNTDMCVPSENCPVLLTIGRNTKEKFQKKPLNLLFWDYWLHRTPLSVFYH